MQKALPSNVIFLTPSSITVSYEFKTQPLLHYQHAHELPSKYLKSSEHQLSFKHQLSSKYQSSSECHHLNVSHHLYIGHQLNIGYHQSINQHLNISYCFNIGHHLHISHLLNNNNHLSIDHHLNIGRRLIAIYLSKISHLLMVAHNFRLSHHSKFINLLKTLTFHFSCFTSGQNLSVWRHESNSRPRNQLSSSLSADNWRQLYHFCTKCCGLLSHFVLYLLFPSSSSSLASLSIFGYSTPRSFLSFLRIWPLLSIIFPFLSFAFFFSFLL